jgi:hypothetical protein
MRKRYPYARWVDDRIKHTPKEMLQEKRGAYYSSSGRVAHYDEYAKWCRLWGYEYDNAPEGYWDAKTKNWHTYAGTAMGALGVMAWFLLSIVAGSTGQQKR